MCSNRELVTRAANHAGLDVLESKLEVTIATSNISPAAASIPFDVVRVDVCTTRLCACQCLPIELDLCFGCQAASHRSLHLVGLNLNHDPSGVGF